MESFSHPMLFSSVGGVAGHNTFFPMMPPFASMPTWPMFDFSLQPGLFPPMPLVPPMETLGFELPGNNNLDDHYKRRRLDLQLKGSRSEEDETSVPDLTLLPSMFVSTPYNLPLLAASSPPPGRSAFQPFKHRNKYAEEKETHQPGATRKRQMAPRLGQLTYADMIEQAIILSKQPWLPVSAIYMHFERHFPEFTSKHPKWQDCVRRTLTINRCRFERQERTSGVARVKRGPGGYWGLVGTPTSPAALKAYSHSESSADDAAPFKSVDSTEQAEEPTPSALSPSSNHDEDSDDDVAKILLSLSSSA